MPNEYTYSNSEELERLSKEVGFQLPTDADKGDDDIIYNPFAKPQESLLKEEDIPDEFLGEWTSIMIDQYAGKGWRPNLKQSSAYRVFESQRKIDGFKAIGDAVANVTSQLVEGGWELTKDTATLKAPKVLGSIIEGGAVGTMSYLHMIDEARYNESSWLHKLLFNTSSNDEDYHLNLGEALNARQTLEKETKEGIWIPHKVNIGGMDLELTNPATVTAVSFVADPSIIFPALGIEAKIAKAFAGGAEALTLGSKMGQASAFAMKKASQAFGKTADVAEKVSSAISQVDKSFTDLLSNITGHDHYISAQGSAVAKDGLVRSAENALAVNTVKIPAWGLTTGVWGVTRILEGGLRVGELGAELLTRESPIAGMSLSERIAMESTSPSVRTMASFWSRTGTPLLNWAGSTTKTALHSSMYGGAFGVLFGGEEGFYHGLGTGLVLGGAFHQIGVLHHTVAGGNAIMDTVKQFGWATAHYDYYNQEGVARLLKNVEQKGGVKGQLSVMAQVGAIERILRDEKFRILTEERIKQMSSDSEWSQYEARILADPNWGGVTFGKDKNGDNIIIVNADRATNSAVKEELFHGILLNGRYGKAFRKSALDSLIGTEDQQGALYKMPKNEAVKLLKGFRDQYLNLEKTTKSSNDKLQKDLLGKFNEQIAKFEKGERPPEVRGIFEEFLASYWNRFLEDKPIDYLLKGGDLGLIRNVIEGAKDVYLNIMHKDLKDAGAYLNAGADADSFLIDQRTKQRVKIPMLDALMQHFVKSTKGKFFAKKGTAEEGSYRGWQVDADKYLDNHTLISNGLEHNIATLDENGNVVQFTDSEKVVIETDAIKNIAQELKDLKPEDRGIKMVVVGDNGENVASFSPSKKPKKEGVDFWADVIGRVRITEGLDRAQSRSASTGKEEPVKKGMDVTDLQARQAYGSFGAKKHHSRDVSNRWRETETDDGLPKNEWVGKPRIKLIGLAKPQELAILRRYLDKNVVDRFVELNNVIEKSRAGLITDMNNVLFAKIQTDSTENADGSRSEGTFRTRTFVPIEMSLVFNLSKVKEEGSRLNTRTIKEASIQVTTLDMDKLTQRRDYAWTRLDEDGVNYRTVQKLFGSKEYLFEAVKAMLSHYSNGETAEAGIKLFQKDGGSVRDMALKRDIVNAIIGSHPTKLMVNRNRGWENQPLDMQFRQKGMKDELPTVYRNFKLRNIGKVKSYEGEGFKINNERSYPRTQANYSPAKTNRDHQGNPMTSGISHDTHDSIYRNQEGELLAVHPLRTRLSSRNVISESQVFDLSTGELVDATNNNLSTQRNSHIVSNSGWSHYTTNSYEAGFVAQDLFSTGYVRTQNHLDLGDIPHSTSVQYLVDSVASKIADLTGIDALSVKGDLLKVKTETGELLYDVYQKNGDLFTSEHSDSENILFNKNSKAFFKKYGIDSVEYKKGNPVTNTEFNAVALMDNSRFVENKEIHSLSSDKFMLSPAKHNTVLQNVEEVLNRTSRKVGSGDVLAGLLEFTIDKDGAIIPNTSRVSQNLIENEIFRSQNFIDEAREHLEKVGVYTLENRQKYVEAIKPLVVRRLKQVLTSARAKGLSDRRIEKLADYSLQGWVQDYASTNRQNRNEIRARVINDSLFLHSLKKYGVNPEKIRESGLPTLAHWVEMSEAEYTNITKLQEVAQKVKPEKLADYLQKKQKGLWNFILDNGGSIAGIFDKLSLRHQDLLRVIDKESGAYSGYGNKQSDGLTDLSVEKLTNLFADKSRLLLEKHLETLKGPQKSALKELKDNYKKMTLAGRDANHEGAIALQQLEAYKRRAESIIHENARERILDIASAYNIKDIPAPVLEKIRTQMYFESQKGLYELGSPDAMARSVELYLFHGGEGAIKDVAGLRKAIKLNYIKALTEASEKGYYGLNWIKEDLSKAGNLGTVGNSVFIGAGGQTKLSNIARLYRFAGTDHYISISDTYNSTYRLMNYHDSEGKVVLSDKVGIDLDSVETSSRISLFQKEATNKVIKEIPEAGIANSHSQEIVGPLKEFYLRKYFNELNTPQAIDNLENLVLTKYGNQFLVRAINNFKGISEKIETLKNKLIREKNVDVQVKLRDSITRLEGIKYQDLGATFNVDKRNLVRVGEIFVTQEQRTRWINGKFSEVPQLKEFESYIKDMFQKHNASLNVHRQKQNQKFREVFSEKDDKGVIPQIKSLIDDLQTIEKEKRKRVFEKRDEENRRRKKERKGERPIGNLEAIAELKSDLVQYGDDFDASQKQIIATAIGLRRLGYDTAIVELSKDPDLLEEINFHLDNSSEIDPLIPPTQNGENPIIYAQRLVQSLKQQQKLYIENKDKYEKLQNLLDDKSPDVQEVKDKIYFLARRYLNAKGFDLPKRLTDALGVKDEVKKLWITTDDNGLLTTDFNYAELKKYSKGEKTEPFYLSDEDGLLGAPEKYAKSIDDLTYEFKLGLMDIEHQYSNIGQRQELTYRDILNLGRVNINTEFSVPAEIKRRTMLGNFSPEEMAFFKDPMNRRFIAEIETGLKNNVLTDERADEMLKNAYVESIIGRDGIELQSVNSKINEANNKLAQLLTEVDKDGNLTNIPEVTKLRNLVQQLSDRKNKILQKAQEDDAPLALKKVAEKIINEDIATRGVQERAQLDAEERRASRQAGRVAKRELARQYKSVAKTQNFNSDDVVSLNNPKTRMLVNAYPSLAYDLFGINYAGNLDLSLSVENAGPISLWTGESSMGTDNSPFAVRSAQRNENKNARQIIVADYIHRANTKLNWYENNPSAKITAEDAHLMQFFYPQAVEQSQTIRDRIANIPKDHMEAMEGRANTILDRFSNETEKSRFIRSFVRDALDMISGDRNLRLEALRKLKGMDEATFYDKWLKETPEADVESMVSSREIIESAMYLIKDGKVVAGPAGSNVGYRDSILKQNPTNKDLAILESYRKSKGMSKQEFENRILNRTMDDNLPKQIRDIISNKNYEFMTRKKQGFVDVDTLIRMKGFDSIWHEEVNSATDKSYFDQKEFLPVKRKYEELSTEQRMNLSFQGINKWMAENTANNIKTAREVYKRGKNKGVIGWFGRERLEGFNWSPSIPVEQQARQVALDLIDTIRPVEATIARFKNSTTTLINKRPFAIDHLLSLDDHLKIDGITRNKDNKPTIDWDNPSKPQYRETKNGKYLIRRSTSVSKKGVQSENFQVYFAGETVVTPDGVVLAKLDPMQFATVTDITQAQVSIRLFEDDMLRLRKSSHLITGGKDNYSPIKVGDSSFPIPKTPTGMSVDNIPLFTQTVLELYMRNNGKPQYRQEIVDSLKGIGDYAEPVYVRLEKADGSVKTNRILMTPSEEAMKDSSWSKELSPDGHTLWVHKENVPVVEREAVRGQPKTTQDTTTQETTKPTVNDEILSESSNWNVERSSIPTAQKPLKEWTEIKNGLGYTIIRLDDALNNRNVFRLFNRASVYLSEFRTEGEAVDEAYYDAIMKGKK